MFVSTLTGICNPKKCEATCAPGLNRCSICEVGIACYPPTSKCNFFIDCVDGSDELNCTYVSTKCSESEFQCDNGECIDSSFVCDSNADCLDASDEHEHKCYDHICGPNHYACSATGKCIDIEKLCDDTPDCLQGNDELSCSSDKCNSLACEYSCRPSSDGGLCYCKPGFQVNVTEAGANTCIDYNECHGPWPVCEQMCSNTEGSFFCSCHNGYIIDADGRSCNLFHPYSEVLHPVVVRGHKLTAILNDNWGGVDLSTNGSKSLAVGYDSSYGTDYYIFWVDNSKLNVLKKMQSTATLEAQVPLKHMLEDVVSMAADWLTKNIYLLHNSRVVNDKFDRKVKKPYSQVILVNLANMSAPREQTIIDSGIQYPQDIALDSKRGFLFIAHHRYRANIFRKNGMISKFDTSGKFIKNVITTRLLNPQGIALDSINKRIFFVDMLRDVIEMCDYEGRGRQVLYEGGAGIPRPYDMVLSGHTLYITDQTKMEIVSLDILDPHNSLKVVEDYHKSQDQVYQIAIADYHSLAAHDKNICHESLCEQICTPVPADFMLGSVSLAPKCSCEDGYVLNDDKMSCRRPVEDSDRYLLYVDHNILKGRLVNQSSDDVTVPMVPVYAEEDNNIVGISGDGSKRVIYYSYGVTGKVMVYNMVTGEQTHLATINGEIESLAADYLNHWLYAADVLYHRIYAIKLTDPPGSSEVIPLISAPYILALDVLPFKGQLFWISDNLLSRSEDEEKFAAVMRSNCDGSEVTKIISKDLHKPRSIAVNSHTERVYVSDISQHSIMNCNLDGDNCYRIPFSNTVLSLAVEVRSGGLYVGTPAGIDYMQPVEGGSPAQFTTKHVASIEQGLLGKAMRVLDFGIYPYQRAYHPCERLNDCEGYCFTAHDATDGSIARRCACPPGQSLSGNTQCVTNSSAYFPSICGVNTYECHHDHNAGECYFIIIHSILVFISN
ncbi:hypothetical protein EB796_008036 [Bugula neritina]|uniref:EGF-like domain-containing protein n=1 Tax=Bugula neritina TaxID=10212 RepID=A0A7J7K616_BUGNE|nr:hypothetical protein EB796_008036 [Bugula neritina]